MKEEVEEGVGKGRGSCRRGGEKGRRGQGVMRIGRGEEGVTERLQRKRKGERIEE